jgi:spore coat polysaccharide biosynthesis protein SpsF (cytidylyltransferase family)
MIPAFITVRTASTRLPGKCLLPFGNGNVLEHVIRRARHYELDAIVCTSVDPADGVIEKIAKSEGVKSYRGPVLNKLKRWAGCCAAFNISAFHTVDADDPFFDGEEVKRSFEVLGSGGYDMVAPTPSSAAGGASVGYSLTRSIVERAVATTGPDDDTEMMWHWIEKIEGVRKAVLPASGPDSVTARLTLDYEEDYRLLETVRHTVGNLAPRAEVDALFRRDPDLYKVNWFRNAEWADNQQKKGKATNGA